MLPNNIKVLLDLIEEFKGDAETGKFQCILVNPKKKSVTWANFLITPCASPP